MKIEVTPFSGAIDNELVAVKTVVVIDVLRATSVMVTAMQNGAKEILPIQTIQQAQLKANELKKDSFLLCGERNVEKIKGFDLGNSPLEFTREVIENKTLIITTSNGTKALNACREAETIYIGAFLNLDAIIKKIKEVDEVVLVCSGTNGRFSLDDGMCAAAIIDGLSKQNRITIDDFGQSLLMTYQSRQGKLIEILKNCFHLNYLNKIGYQQDVKFCLQTNVYNIIPWFSKENNMIIV